MAANPNVYVSGVEAGLSKVLSENYSFILDQPMATYLANKRCELTVMTIHKYNIDNKSGCIYYVGLYSHALFSHARTHKRTHAHTQTNK